MTTLFCKAKTSLLIIVFVLFFLTTLSPAFAATDLSTYTPLEALPDNQGIISTNAIPVSTFFTNVYYFALTAAVFLSVLMIIWGGIQYMARGVSESMAKGAKDRIKKALLGLLLALGSYLILKTINPELINPTIFIPSPAGGKVVYPDVTAPPGGAAGGGAVPGDIYGKYTDGSSTLFDSMKATESAYRRLFEDEGIDFNNDPCTNIGQSGCTNVALLPGDAIQNLLELKAACLNCNITINGGTEWWEHDEHGPYRPIVDLAPDTALSRYLSTNGTRFTTGSRSGYVVPGIGSFVDEGSHWHVYLNQ